MRSSFKSTEQVLIDLAGQAVVEPVLVPEVVALNDATLLLSDGDDARTPEDPGRHRSEKRRNQSSRSVAYQRCAEMDVPWLARCVAACHLHPSVRDDVRRGHDVTVVVE